MTGTARGSFIGRAPTVLIQPAPPKKGNGQLFGNPEQLKYEKMWAHEQYRAVAPGENCAQLFLAEARPPAGAHVIDFGCGTGRGAIALAMFGKVKVTLVDFAINCLDPFVYKALSNQGDTLKFIQADLEKPLPVAAQYGFCTDVMEHIPEDKVEIVLKNIMKAAEYVFFQISTTDDACGVLIGEKLHLTVKPPAWWSLKFRNLGAQVNWYKEYDNCVMLYATAWNSAREIAIRGTLNTVKEKLIENIQLSTKRGWPQMIPHDRQDRPALVLCGGPSLNDYADEIRQKREGGHSLITVNGAYKWALDHGMVPSAQVMLDGREFNKRFLEPIVENCHYFIASHCDPATFDMVPKGKGLIWHCVDNEELAAPLNEHYGEGAWFYVPGGSTVVLRTIVLLRMLGVWRQELYGFDSCLKESWVCQQADGSLVKHDTLGHILEYNTKEEAQQASDTLSNDFGVPNVAVSKYGHHAYEQKENDGQSVVKVTCGGRIFYCNTWMVSQAHEFMDQVKFMGNEVELAVHGDGLIAHIIKTGAELPDKE